MRKPESRLQLKIRQRLEEEFGGYWRKIHGGPFQHAGIPDIIGCVKGLFFGFEVKRPGEELSKLQREELDQIFKEGEGSGGQITSPEEAIKLVRRALRRAAPRR